MTDAAPQVTNLFIEFSRHKLFVHYWPRLRACVEPLTEEQVWWRPNPASNSIANLILHLSGNVGQWLVASFNHERDARNRPAEFAAESGLPASQLLAILGATMDEAALVLTRLTEADLVAPYESRATTSLASKPSTRSSSTSASTTARSPTSPKASQVTTLVSIENYPKPAVPIDASIG